MNFQKRNKYSKKNLFFRKYGGTPEYLNDIFRLLKILVFKLFFLVSLTTGHPSNGFQQR